MITFFRQRFSTPELVQAAREEADALVDDFLRNPQDSSVLNDILHCGDSEMFAKSPSLTLSLMHAMGTVQRIYTEKEYHNEVAELETAATRLQAMLHRGVFLTERLERESHPRATEMADIVRTSLLTTRSAFDAVTARLFSLKNGIIAFKAEHDAGTETNGEPTKTKNMRIDVSFLLPVAIGILIIIKSCG